VDRDFTEEELNTFEGWARYQMFDIGNASASELEVLLSAFEDARARAARRPMGRMKLRVLRQGEFRYAVGVREGESLWLVLWIHRTPLPKPGVYVNHLTGERGRHPHTSYHSDGTLWMKSHDRVMAKSYKRQPLTGAFRGVEHMGTSAGFAPRGVGAVCDPLDFSGVVEVPAGVLGPVAGSIAVDLVEPGREPTPIPWTRIVAQKVFTEADPWIAVRVLRSTSP
jgi:hypothetical protein